MAIPLAKTEREEKKTPWQTLLAIGGGLALITGLYLSFGQVYDRIYPNEPSLVAEGDMFLVSKLPLGGLTDEEAKKIVDEQLNAPVPQITPEAKDSLKLLVKGMLIEATKSTAKQNEFGSQWVLTVENKGKKKATDVTIKLPFGGRYALVGSKPPAIRFSHNIPIGELHSSDLTRVVIWTDDDVAYKPTETYRVTFAEGPASTINFPALRKQEKSVALFLSTAIAAIFAMVSVVGAMYRMSMRLRDLRVEVLEQRIRDRSAFRDRQ